MYDNVVLLLFDIAEHTGNMDIDSYIGRISLVLVPVPFREQLLLLWYLKATQATGPMM